MGGGGRKNPKSIHFYKQTHAYIYYFCTCDKILIFTNGLQVFIVDTFCYSFWWQSHGHGFHLLFITWKGVTAHPSFLIVTLIHLLAIATLVPLTSKPLLWLGLGLWTPKPLGQQQACCSEVFPTISITDPVRSLRCPTLSGWTWPDNNVSRIHFFFGEFLHYFLVIVWL